VVVKAGSSGYKGFVDKILNARNFEEAMELRPKRNISKWEEVVALVDQICYQNQSYGIL
jgi:hypothetical protein